MTSTATIRRRRRDVTRSRRRQHDTAFTRLSQMCVFGVIMVMIAIHDCRGGSSSGVAAAAAVSTASTQQRSIDSTTTTTVGEDKSLWDRTVSAFAELDPLGAVSSATASVSASVSATSMTPTASRSGEDNNETHANANSNVVDAKKIVVGGRSDGVVEQDYEDDRCGVYYALSTIPGAGLGIFAGRNYRKGEYIHHTGDLAIPIVDIVGSQRSSGSWDFLWDEYTWNAEGLHMNYEGIDEVNVASHGFGAASNCFLPIYNVAEGTVKNDAADLHRSRDPGVGGFSTYYDRRSSTRRAIHAGEEFFVSYGSNWFTSRSQLGPIPLYHDLDKAYDLFKSHETLKNNLIKIARRTTGSISSDIHPKINTILDDMWDTFVRDTTYKESRVIGSFNHNNKEEEFHSLRTKYQMNLKKLRIEQSTRSIEHLEEYGVCADNIKAAKSTIKQAGRGAFATRTLRQGQLVAPMPLIHIPDRRRLYNYRFTKDDESGAYTRYDTDQPPIGYQLLLNYCFGHGESSLLLCPYGPIAGFINHNQTLANVKIQWADPKRGNHNPTLLDDTIGRLESDATAKLAFELVALRDIQPNEEIFMDYGDEWEHAWQQHVINWEPIDDANTYRAAWQLNADTSLKIPTIFEKMDDPDNMDVRNVELRCDSTLVVEREDYEDDNEMEIWRQHHMNGTLSKYLLDEDGYYWSCDVLRSYYNDVHDEYLYDIVIIERDDDKEEEYDHKFTNVPRQIFRYFDKPQTSDMFLPNAFRHDMRIPNDIFPQSWKNKYNKKQRYDDEEEEEADDEDEEEGEEEPREED